MLWGRGGGRLLGTNCAILNQYQAEDPPLRAARCCPPAVASAACGATHADFARLASECESIIKEAGADWLHIDVMGESERRRLQPQVPAWRVRPARRIPDAASC